MRTAVLLPRPCCLFGSRLLRTQFLYGRLVGEGNVGRHLELLGYKLPYYSHYHRPCCLSCCSRL
jgi:hypothetical protein